MFCKYILQLTTEKIFCLQDRYAKIDFVTQQLTNLCPFIQKTELMSQGISQGPVQEQHMLQD